MTDAEVVPRLAATVVLLRPGRAGLEVLLTRRPASMAFAPDMHVFPGGRVDAADADPPLIARSVVSPVDAAIGLGGDLEPELAIAAWIAAIREVFEECGVLLAERRTSARRRKGSDAIALGRFPAGSAAEEPAPGHAIALGRFPEGSAAEEPAPVDAIAQGRWPGDPGFGRAIGQARSALVGGDASFASIVEELDLTLRTDLLVPLSRWVTPPVLPRRFDARFFAAALPAGARVSFEGDEVAGHAWLTPRAALDAMASGDVAMWIPTSATLQQLERAGSIGQIRDRLAPSTLAEPRVEVVSPEVTRIVMPAGGGVPGQPIAAYLVGRSRFVLIDPGDPIGPGLDLAIATAAARGGAIEAIALTQVAPDHAAGAEGLSEMLRGLPVLAGPGAAASLPYAVELVSEDTILAHGDVPIRAFLMPGPTPEHLAFLVGDDLVIAGDLDGRSGGRSIGPPPDQAAIAASGDRLRTLAPDALWLSSHPAVDPA